MANVEIHDRTVLLVTQLNEALGSRSVIDQARGILTARTGCSAEAAIESLKKCSQREPQLRDIASELVADATMHAPGG